MIVVLGTVRVDFDSMIVGLRSFITDLENTIAAPGPQQYNSGL